MVNVSGNIIPEFFAILNHGAFVNLIFTKAQAHTPCVIGVIP